MLKRVTKVTSLLVAAASIVSMVPAMAADIQKFDAKEGTIYSAMAKGGGKFVIDGEINGEAEAIYYVANGKYTKLDNASPGDTINYIISDKYLKMNDGDYYIDLTTGEKTEEDIDQNLKDDRAGALRKQIKNDNDGRFDDTEYTGKIVAANFLIGGPTTTWSEYQYELGKEDLTGKQTSMIYADSDGKYIDVDYNIGNVKVYTTGTSVIIKNTEDTYEVKDGNTTYEIKAQIKGNDVYCENPNDFYRKAELSIWSKVKGTADNTFVNITDSVDFGPASNHHAAIVSDDGSSYGNYVAVMQVISKDQASDDINGIKYAKNVSTYFVADEDGKAEPTLGLGTSDKTGTAMMIGNANGFQSILLDDTNKKIYAQTVSFKTKDGYNYVDLGNVEDTSYDVFGIGSGQIFCIDGGYIKHWNNKDSFDKVYKVDGGMTKMSINDQGSIVVWNQDDEMYSVIDVPPTVPAGDKAATATTPAVKTRWAKAADGTWTYVKADGTKATGWFLDGAAWYYLKADGIMATGWQNISGIWYYLNMSGVMQTGWINDNGTWYYSNSSGAMLANTIVDGYVLGIDGAWIK